MTLYDKIIALYPALTADDFMTHIALQNDGEGDYIAQWDHPIHPRPSDEQLAAITEPYSPPFEDVREEYFDTEVRPLREMILNRMTGIAVLSDEADTLLESIKTARRALLSITTAPDVVAATNTQELHDAVLAYYRGVVASMPASLRTVFNGVDA